MPSFTIRPGRNPGTYNVFGFRKDKRLRLQKQYLTHKKQGKTDINDPGEMYIKTAGISGTLKTSKNVKQLRHPRKI